MADRLDEVVKEVAEKLNYPPEVVMNVVTYVFEYTWRFFKNPHKVALRLPYLGLFYISMFKLRAQITKAAKWNHDNFKKIWPLRHMVYRYHAKHNLNYYGKRKRPVKD